MQTTFEISANNLEASLFSIREAFPHASRLKITVEDMENDTNIYKNVAEQFKKIQKTFAKYKLPKDFNIDETANESNL